MSEQILQTDKLSEGIRADVYLSDALELTRSAVQKLFSDNQITATKNGKQIEFTKKTAMSEGMVIIVNLPEPEACEAKPENIPLDIVYEDSDIIIINKPAGMVVHPAPGHENGTLVSALLYHCADSLSGINGVLRPGIVHRIDKDTTGLIAVAKNDDAHISLASQLADHSMHRIYYAIATGNIKEDEGTIDAPIGRHPADRKKMAVLTSSDKKSRNAVTHYKVLARNNGFTYLKIRLETGRTHQIRVHMSHIGHPLAGDTVYGGGKTLFERKHPALFSVQLLHAGELTLKHPRTGEVMTFRSDLPETFDKALTLLELKQELE